MHDPNVTAVGKLTTTGTRNRSAFCVSAVRKLPTTGTRNRSARPSVSASAAHVVAAMTDLCTGTKIWLCYRCLKIEVFACEGQRLLKKNGELSCHYCLPVPT